MIGRPSISSVGWIGWGGGAASVAAHGIGIAAIISFSSGMPAVDQPTSITVEVVAAAPADIAPPSGKTADNIADNIIAGSPRDRVEPAVVDPVTAEQRPEPDPLVDPIVAEKDPPVLDPQAVGIAAAAPVMLTPRPTRKPTPPQPAAVSPTTPVPDARARNADDKSSEPQDTPADGTSGQTQLASLPQQGRSFVSADYTHRSLGNEPPRYPRRARRDGLEGRVVLTLAVAASGYVRDATISQSSGHVILDRAAVKAVRAWRVAPATLGGIPVASTLQVPILFRLDSK